MSFSPSSGPAAGSTAEDPQRSCNPSNLEAQDEPESEEGSAIQSPRVQAGARTGSRKPFDTRWQIYIDNLDILELWSLDELSEVLAGETAPSELQHAIHRVRAARSRPGS